MCSSPFRATRGCVRDDRATSDRVGTLVRTLAPPPTMSQEFGSIVLIRMSHRHEVTRRVVLSPHEIGHRICRDDRFPFRSLPSNQHRVRLDHESTTGSEISRSMRVRRLDGEPTATSVSASEIPVRRCSVNTVRQRASVSRSTPRPTAHSSQRHSAAAVHLHRAIRFSG